jgi:hypothetical protein
VLEDTVLKVTVVVGPAPAAPEDPLQVGLPAGQAAFVGLGIAFNVTAVPLRTYRVPVMSTKDVPLWYWILLTVGLTVAVAAAV